MIQEFFLIVVGLLFSVLAVGTALLALHSTRRLRRFLGVPSGALDHDSPPSALVNQPCEVRYRAGDSQREAVLVTQTGADAAFTREDLAAIQSYLGAVDYEIAAAGVQEQLEITFQFRKDDWTAGATDDVATSPQSADAAAD